MNLLSNQNNNKNNFTHKKIDEKKFTEKNAYGNLKTKRCKSISKINLTNVGIKKDIKVKVKRVSVDCNLPSVSKIEKNNGINTTSKKPYRNNNNIRNYNIPPLVLPFIKV